jgi:integrase/recombinase XerD
MEPRFEQFIKERHFLHNVSPRTLEWYRASLKYLPCDLLPEISTTEN